MTVLGYIRKKEGRPKYDATQKGLGAFFSNSLNRSQAPVSKVENKKESLDRDVKSSTKKMTGLLPTLTGDESEESTRTLDPLLEGKTSKKINFNNGSPAASELEIDTPPRSGEQASNDFSFSWDKMVSNQSDLFELSDSKQEIKTQILAKPKVFTDRKGDRKSKKLDSCCDEAPKLDIVSLVDSFEEKDLFAGLTLNSATEMSVERSPFEDSERWAPKQLVCDYEFSPSKLSERSPSERKPSRIKHPREITSKRNKTVEEELKTSSLSSLGRSFSEAESTLLHHQRREKKSKKDVVHIGNGVELSSKGHCTVLTMDRKVFEDHEESLMRLLGDSKFKTFQQSYSKLSVYDDDEISNVESLTRVSASEVQSESKLLTEEGETKVGEPLKQVRRKLVWNRFWGKEARGKESRDKKT